MIRNVKVMGLAVVAVFAFGAISASVASAAEPYFRSSEETTSITSHATSNHVFTAAGHTISCEKANFEGTQTGSPLGSEFVTDEATVQGSYSGCSFLGVGVSVSMGGCAYKFHSDTGTVDVVNNPYTEGNCSTSPITFKASVLGGLVSCTVKVGPQTGITGIGYANASGDIEQEVNVPASEGKAIEYTATSTGGGCTAGSNNNGTYEGDSLIEGGSATISWG